MLHITVMLSLPCLRALPFRTTKDRGVFVYVEAHKPALSCCKVRSRGSLPMHVPVINILFVLGFGEACFHLARLPCKYPAVHNLRVSCLVNSSYDSREEKLMNLKRFDRSNPQSLEHVVNEAGFRHQLELIGSIV